MRLTGDRPQALSTATELIRELGYQPEVPAGGDAIPTKWYDIESVFDLSSVEADVIARRVVGKLRAMRQLPPPKAEDLETAVAEALRKHFAARWSSDETRPGQFRRDAVQSAAAAARGILDEAEVTDFVATLEADLNEDHTHDAGI